ncbi:HDOD domain-containing protein, partial [Candidatus Latescibacterota bacterium]
IKPIDSLSRAIVALGFSTIQDIAISASVITYFHNSKGSMGIDLPGLWIHSLGTAKAAQLIAQKINFGNLEIVFITGLLHDIGKIIIWVNFPEYYFQINELTTHDKVRSLLAERKVLNADHSMVGQLLCNQWNLPPSISTAIANHHDPSEVDKNKNCPVSLSLLILCAEKQESVILVTK